MRSVVFLCSAIILLAVAACDDDSADAPAPTDTPLPAPTAPASAALRAPDPTPTITSVAATAAAVAPVQSPTSTASPVTTSAQPLTPTLAPTLAPTLTHTPSPTPVPTATQTPSPVTTRPLTATPTPVPTATHTAVPTATHTATAKNTPVATATETPVPTATATPTPVPTDTPTPTPTNTPLPTPSVDPALANYSPLLAEAVTSYPAGLDFVGDGLSPDERKVLDWADSRLFTNTNFLASKYGPDNWPSDVKLASVQAVPLLMLAIDIQKRDDGKHVINWELDGLDRLLDELGIYEGVCVTCYGKSDYGTREEVTKNYEPIVADQRHVHREMLKTFAYFARADGEEILVRGLMANDADDFEFIYKRDTEELLRGGSVSVTEYGFRNLSFMSLTQLPDGTIESFPTMVYEIVGGARSEREAAERWFGHLNEVMRHYTGSKDDAANLYRPYSQSPHNPKPGEVLGIVKEAGSWSSTGMTASAFRSLGLKAEQFLSPEKGRRTGAVEIDGEWFYHNGNIPLAVGIVPMCAFFATLEEVETSNYEPSCGE